jgi:RecQ family ATP-dependent DNA helicase
VERFIKQAKQKESLCEETSASKVRCAMDANAALQQWFGYGQFRGVQGEAVRGVLNNRDVLVIAPTGAGKSLMFQLPALMLPGVAIVVSPLIALMQNQVDALKARKIPAEFINSTLSVGEQLSIWERIFQKTLFASSGEQKDCAIKLLYVTPEMLGSESGRERLQQMAKKNLISLFAIDECHCISSWGHDFRPAYRKMSFLRTTYRSIPIIALTATATQKVKDDVLQSLKLDVDKTLVLVSNFDRENIVYTVRFKDNLSSPMDDVADLVSKFGKNASGLVYCLKREDTATISLHLKSKGLSAAAYHAGLSKTDRSSIQSDWESGKIQIVCCTIAFGMGIDKANVRFVVHWTISKTVEGYYQESGRGGRDGKPCAAILYYSERERSSISFLEQKTSAEKQAKRKTPPVAVNPAEKLFESMIEYATKAHCRRQFLVEYFGQKLRIYDRLRYGGVYCCDYCTNPEAVKNSFAEANIRAASARSFSNTSFKGARAEIVKAMQFSGGSSSSSDHSGKKQDDGSILPPELANVAEDQRDAKWRKRVAEFYEKAEEEESSEEDEDERRSRRDPFKAMMAKRRKLNEKIDAKRKKEEKERKAQPRLSFAPVSLDDLKNQLEKHSSNPLGFERDILRVLKDLDSRSGKEITAASLESSGLGILVNNLRKSCGDNQDMAQLKQAASKLLKKWKQIVAGG